MGGASTNQVRGAAGDAQVSGEEHRPERSGRGTDVRAPGAVRREGSLGGHGSSRRLAHYAGSEARGGGGGSTFLAKYNF